MIAPSKKKLICLYAEGFRLSLNDRRIVLLGQLLPLLRDLDNFESIARQIDDDILALALSKTVLRHPPQQ